MQRVFWVFLFVVVGFLIFTSLRPVDYMFSHFTYADDGFYYLGYARNIASGNGPTFDGIVETNGVQPLWTLVLTALALVISDPVGLLQVSLVVSAVLAGLAAVFIYRGLQLVFEPRAAVVGGLFFLALLANPSYTLSGMETPVNLFTFSLALYLTLSARTTNPRRIMLSGIALGLVCLSRIDNVIVTPAFALLLVYQNGTLKRFLQGEIKPMLMSVLWLALPTLVMFGSYILFNLVVFDRPLPISGDVKSVWQEQYAATIGGRFALAYLGETTQLAASHYQQLLLFYLINPLIMLSPFVNIMRVGVVLALLVMLLWVIKRRLSQPSRLISGNALVFVVGFAVVLNVFFHTWMLFFQTGARNASPLSWYYVPEYVLITYGLVLFSKWVSELLGRPGVLQLVAGWVVFGVTVNASILLLGGVVVSIDPPILTMYQAADWANENVSDDAILGGFNSGAAGYFTDAALINLDGLMNNHEILAVAEGHADINDYIDRYEVEYIMDYAHASWSPESGVIFRGIPTERLEQVYAEPFVDYGGTPTIYYIFRVVQ